jgi:hypothetical protein
MSETIKMKTTAKITIGGKEITINKLKAGKFYEAQKSISEMFKKAAELSTDPKATTEGKVPDMKDVDISNLVGLFEEFPQHVAKFVSICIDMTDKDLLEKAYPEEINEAFGVCLELNNVMENLKNSVAPIGKLGGGVPKA